MNRRAILATVAFLAVPLAAQAQQSDSATVARGMAACPRCEANWFADQQPLRIYGNTYYVGTRGLSSILITSPRGDVVIDGGLSENAPLILAHIRALGFRVEDVKLVLNTHAHYDHAGGIAELARASGATVAASPASAAWLEHGKPGKNDPQFGLGLDYPPVPHVRVIHDGEVLRVGDLALTAHFTPGHTPGGTSWSWQSCETSRCLQIVDGDSQTAVSADGFLFTRNDTYPNALADFEHGLTTLEHLRCDILLTPHPDASHLWERIAAREAGTPDALIDSTACRRYAAAARTAIAQRVAKERATR